MIIEHNIDVIAEATDIDMAGRRSSKGQVVPRNTGADRKAERKIILLIFKELMISRKMSIKKEDYKFLKN